GGAAGLPRPAELERAGAAADRAGNRRSGDDPAPAGARARGARGGARVRCDRRQRLRRAGRGGTARIARLDRKDAGPPQTALTPPKQINTSKTKQDRRPANQYRVQKTLRSPCPEPSPR